MGILDLITLLIFLSAGFTLINITVLKLPSTIGLMAIALIMSVIVLISGIFIPHLTDVAVHIMEEFDFQEVLLHVMLSFLLFAGALSIDLSKLVEERIPILVLATFGVLMSTAIVGFLMFEVFQYVGEPVPLVYCLLFGALISPTDPIAVLALIKKANLSKNLEIKIAGESLFNDGIGVVVFLTILSVAERGVDFVSGIDITLLFGQEVLGGLAMGAGLGFIGFKLLDYIENDHVELEVLVTLSLVTGGNRIAELLHLSGPLAMVTMGLFIGNEGRSDKLAQATGEYVYKFWHLLDEALNAILFILIGLEMIVIAQTFKADYIAIGMIAVGVVLVARFIGVSIPIMLMSRWRSFEKGTIAILTWGGLRGGLSVAMALSLPDELLGVYKDLIVASTYSVVLFSILVQGLTISKLIKK